MTQDWVHGWGEGLVADWAREAGGDGDADAAFDNSSHVPDADRIIGRIAADSAALRAELGARARLGLPYGDHPRAVLDLFVPEHAPRGLMVFVHGGYWRMGDRAGWSALARGGLARGWAVAVPSYPLTPEVPIADITVAIAAAIARAAGHVAGPIRLVGHSAGGHLVARMACADGPLPAEVAERLQAVCTISGLHDLRPFLSASGMNATLRLNMAQAAAESPALHAPRPGLPVNAWVGGAERPELIRQSRLLAHAWGEACRLHVADEANHFDVVEPLMVPLSLLSTVCLGPGD